LNKGIGRWRLVYGWQFSSGWSEGLLLPMFVFLLCLAGLTFSTVHYFSRWEKGKVLQAARWVHAQSFSGTVVIVPRYLQPLWKYHDRSGLPLVDEAGIDQLTPIIATHTQAILVTTGVPNPVQDALDARFRILNAFVSPPNSIWALSSHPTPTETERHA
jgi:hypothetical protein